ncbi:hypothetical protein NQ315_017387 [Exocentrus adspersus]|uniref:Vacuolar protein sorting-associated protein 54 N-terminal domain-containing protein n=1 Tax=Exocentrus adspersus TaxID=1586481 RepID=A0AAV8VKD8_9CUCU|nr:hypothetical protein NQ315_017387 [Exocentrus adspersus]
MSVDNEHWTIYTAAQHLPAVLNDPNRGKQINFFTKTWGDAFVEKFVIEKSPFLPEITYAHFESYLQKYGKRYKRHLRLSRSKFEDTHINKQKNNDFDKDYIPEIYLKHKFNLNDSKMFAEVFQENKSEHDLQDELSHYLDVIEEKIAHQVSQKSGAFFHAMTSHDTMMEQMGTACSLVRLLRSKIQQVDTTLATDSLKLLGLFRSKVNNVNLLDKLKLMSTVLQTQPTLQLLLSSSDYVAALELISSTQDVLAKELAGVTSLRYLPSQLKEMLKLIEKMLTAEFEKYSAADLHRPFDVNGDILEFDKLVSLVAGLLRQNHYHFFETYKQEAVTAAQTFLKQLMIEQLADVDDEDELSEITGSGEVNLIMDTGHWLQVLKLAGETLGK